MDLKTLCNAAEHLPVKTPKPLIPPPYFCLERRNRAQGGLVRSARALAAAACLCLVGALALPTTVQAQEAETLVSNIGQGSTYNSDSSVPTAQRFTTGPYEYGYTLSTVDVVSVDAEGTGFEAKVCTVDGDGHPTSTCTDLAAPGSSGFAAGTITFYAPANYVLESRTTYTVMLTPPSQGDPVVTYRLTTADGEDAGKADGWSIADTHDFWNQNLSPDGWGTSASGRSFRIAIKGSLAPEPETTRNRPSEIRAYWRDDPDNPYGSNEQEGCESTERFRAYWNPPKSNGSFKRADEWEAEITPKYGASDVSFTIQNTGGEPREPELTGTVDINNSFSSLSMRVRGRFGDAWGAWSPRTGLYCRPADGALQVQFVSPPERHDGEGQVDVRVVFSEQVEESPEEVGAHGVRVEGGKVTSAREVDGREEEQEEREVVWEFEIEPDSDEDLTVSLEAGRPCDEEGAICTADGRVLSEGISTMVRGPDDYMEPEEETPWDDETMNTGETESGFPESADNEEYTEIPAAGGGCAMASPGHVNGNAVRNTVFSLFLTVAVLLASGGGKRYLKP